MTISNLLALMAQPIQDNNFKQLNITIMKTNLKKSIALLVLCFTAMAFNQVKAQEKTVYGFGYAYNYNTKTFYVSNIVNGVENSKTFYDANDNALRTQWMNKLKTEDSEYYTYTIEIFGFSDEDWIDEKRIEWIGKFKSQGFTIVYLTFTFRKSKKD